MRAPKNPVDKSHPHLVPEWNDERDISTLSPGSDYKASWKCPDHGHEYIASVYKRATRSQGCPYCAGVKVLRGFNDIVSSYPELENEWSETNERRIYEVSPKSHYKAEWVCELGHKYISPVSRRASGHGCPYCAGNKILRGHNDLATTHPHLTKEWKDERDITTVSKWSAYKARWQCENGHEPWTATISNRAQSNTQCPYCSGRKPVVGHTDLPTTHPHLINKWDDDRDISEVSAGSTYSARWQCSVNDQHLWKAIVNNRARSQQGCPECSASNYVSAAERDIFDHIVAMSTPETVVRQSVRDLISPYEIDIYVPEKKFAVEFNGLYWHSEARGKDRKYHYDKFTRCREQGVQLIQIWEDDYKRNPELVKTMLAHKMGTSQQPSIAARSTVFSALPSKEAKSFMDARHLQGHHGTSTYFGLTDKVTNEIVAVMGIRYNKKDKSLEISRFASSRVVQGGFTKLLKGIIRQEQRPVNKIVSYSHNDHSWGQVYERNGFVKIHDGVPGYFYVVNGKREHRLNYSPKRFRERDDLIFEEGKTERELAELNDLTRIWDAGSARWEMVL